MEGKEREKETWWRYNERAKLGDYKSIFPVTYSGSNPPVMFMNASLSSFLNIGKRSIAILFNILKIIMPYNWALSFYPIFLCNYFDNFSVKRRSQGDL